MPKVDDPFSGHVFEGDPRTLMYGRRGCPWPTMPAWRYRAVSEDATGAFDVFNDPGILLPTISHPTASVTVIYQWEETDDELLFMEAAKFQDSINRPGYQWGVIMDLACIAERITKLLPISFAKCNTDVLVGNMPDIPPEFGNTGETFTLRQVVYFSEFPPD